MSSNPPSSAGVVRIVCFALMSVCAAVQLALLLTAPGQSTKLGVWIGFTFGLWLQMLFSLLADERRR